MPTRGSLLINQTAERKFWNAQDGNPYEQVRINEIDDKMDDKEVPVTSIPSPFAQFHLVDTAFKALNQEYEKRKSLDVYKGSSTYHRMVAYCLDTFELLFWADKLNFQHRIRIVRWENNKSDKQFNQLEIIKNTTDQGRRSYGETLELFIANYHKSSRFTEVGVENPLDQLTVVLFDGKPVASTSPYTGFAPSAAFNPTVSHPQGALEFNGGEWPTRLNNLRFFFASGNKQTYLTYQERDVEFRQYLRHFFSTHTQLAKVFYNLYEYLRNSGLMSEGNDLIASLSLDFFEMDNQRLAILPKVFYEKATFAEQDVVDLVKGSDYRIKTGKSLEQPPLAIIPGYRESHWNYITGPISEQMTIKEEDLIGFEERTLPDFPHIKYPFIVPSDLLADHMMTLPAGLEFDENAYGNWDKVDAKYILLPIKPAYFYFFTVEDLKENLTIKRVGQDIYDVRLVIPLEADGGRGTFEFRRKYMKTNDPQNLSEGFGAVYSYMFFNVGVYPFFKTDTIVFNDFYRVGLYHEERYQFSLEFFRYSLAKPALEEVHVHGMKVRGQERNLQSVYYELKTRHEGEHVDFDLIAVEEGKFGAQGMLFPHMPLKKIEISNNRSFASFDVGTSNTFVGIKVSNAAEPFSNFSGNVGLGDVQGNGERHLQWLHQPYSTDLKEVFQVYDVDDELIPFQYNEFLPSLIGHKSPFGFPVQTLLNMSHDVRPEQKEELVPLFSVNIPFGISGQDVNLRPKVDLLQSNLKWGIAEADNQAARTKLEVFIEQLLLMARTKIISHGYNPEYADILWFKPLSVSSLQSDIMQEIWERTGQKYFYKTKANSIFQHIYPVTESYAPFFAQPSLYGKSGRYVNLDIGGGTSDIMYFEQKGIQLTGSFRFAGNDLFNEGLGGGRSDKNGFASKYYQEFRKFFSENHRTKSLADNLDFLWGSSEIGSAEIISFLLAFEEFRQKLKLDEDFKLLFLLHNTGLIYHMAQLLKMNDLKPPQVIGLSGNGSRLLAITNKSNQLNKARGMASLVTAIFSEVYQSNELPTIQLEFLENPKEATALGGIKGVEDGMIKVESEEDIKNYIIAIGDDSHSYRWDEISQKKKFEYQFINQDDEAGLMSECVSNYQEFISFFFDKLWHETDLPNRFGVNKSYNTGRLKKYLTEPERLKSAMMEGVNQKQTIEKEEFINESLFFYPLRVHLFDLSLQIASGDIEQFKGFSND